MRERRFCVKDVYSVQSRRVGNPCVRPPTYASFADRSKFTSSQPISTRDPGARQRKRIARSWDDCACAFYREPNDPALAKNANRLALQKYVCAFVSRTNPAACGAFLADFRAPNAPIESICRTTPNLTWLNGGSLSNHALRLENKKNGPDTTLRNDQYDMH